MSTFESFHATFSTRDDLKQLPSKIIEWLNTWCSKFHAVSEKSGKWHVHCVIVLKRDDERRADSVRRTLLALCPQDEPENWGPSALRVDGIKFPCKPEGIAGGYLAKYDGHVVLHSFGFTEEELAQGDKEYQRGSKNKRIRKAASRLRPLQDVQWIALEGTLYAEGARTEEARVREAAENGLAIPLRDARLRAIYTEVSGRAYAEEHGLVWDWTPEPEPKRQRQVEESRYDQVRDELEALKHEHKLLSKKVRKADETIAEAKNKARGDIGMARHVYTGYKAMAGVTAKPFDVWVLGYMDACIKDMH